MAFFLAQMKRYNSYSKKIFNEKVDFKVGPRIDARKEDYQKAGGNVAVRNRILRNQDF